MVCGSIVERIDPVIASFQRFKSDGVSLVAIGP